MFKRIPGTRDILPDEIPLWQKIEATSRVIFSLYNYQEIRPPLVEEASLFNRSLGESTEIVTKQMFLIKKDQDSYALRPEGTASVVRAYIENSLDKKPGFIKLYYTGPMFRMERPQKGRLRQFYHLGCEVIGSCQPQVDIEVISLADNLLKAYSVDGYKIKINSLGCQKDKKVFTESLRVDLKDKVSQLCDDCKLRFKQNVLRILDCKNEGCRKVVAGLNIQHKHLCPECENHFSKVKDGLDFLQVSYEVAPHLVRGLDYYTGTVFEITHDALGSQDALGAGGRYDNLVKQLGGPEVGAVGFAFGIERLLLAIKSPVLPATDNLVYIISLGEEAKSKVLELLDGLRKAGVRADTDYEGKSLKGAMRLANDLNARYVLIIGEDELKEDSVTLKDMSFGKQEKLKITELITHIKEQLRNSQC